MPNYGISAPLLGVLILLLAPPASAQSRDDFAYWDANGNGDLTCAEAGRGEGLRLPAYQDNRDGTDVIYEWLARISHRVTVEGMRGGLGG